MLSYFRNCWSSKCHQFVFLSFKFSQFIYSLFPTPVFCPEMSFSTRVSSNHILTLKCPWWKFEMIFFWGEKHQEHILHINWLVISETNKSLGHFWPFEMVKTWPFLEGGSCPPTIGDQKGHSLKSHSVILPTPKQCTMFDAKHSKIPFAEVISWSL